MKTKTAMVLIWGLVMITLVILNVSETYVVGSVVIASIWSASSRED